MEDDEAPQTGTPPETSDQCGEPEVTSASNSDIPPWDSYPQHENQQLSKQQQTGSRTPTQNERRNRQPWTQYSPEEPPSAAGAASSADEAAAQEQQRCSDWQQWRRARYREGDLQYKRAQVAEATRNWRRPEVDKNQNQDKVMAGRAGCETISAAMTQRIQQQHRYTAAAATPPATDQASGSQQSPQH